MSRSNLQGWKRLAVPTLSGLSVSLVLGACGRTWPAVDTRASEAAELVVADRAFARASASGGEEAWGAVWAEAGRKEAGDGSAVVGPEAVREAMAPVLKRYGSRFRWEPEHAAMLWPDTLGYTTGRWWIDGAGGGSGPGGRYLTVWIREGGDWKVALDLGAAVCGDSPESHAFDFWKGDWRIEQRIRAEDGSEESYPARNAVSQVAGACALAESWSGTVRYPWARMQQPRTIRGASIRAYDPARSTWSIYWIDTVTGRFGPPFRGGFAGDIGDFVLQPPDSGAVARRIRFRPARAGAVDWTLAVQQPDSEWLALWSMHFRRR